MAGFSLMVRQIVFVDCDRHLHYFSIRYRWDGGFAVEESERFNAGKDFILVLHSELPYRRKFQLSAKQRSNRNVMLATAASIFPLPVDTLQFAVGIKDDGHYLFAMENDDLQAIIQLCGSARAVLVSDFDVQAIERAIADWLSQGRVCDFAAGRPLPHPALALLVILSLLTMAALGGTVWAWNWHYQQEQQFQREQVRQLSDKAQPLLRKRRALLHMQAAVKAFQELSEMPAATAIEELGEILEKTPKGVNIEKITFDDGELIVAGWGNAIQEWQKALGSSRYVFEINDLPEKDHFTIRVQVEDEPAAD